MTNGHLSVRHWVDSDTDLYSLYSSTKIGQKCKFCFQLWLARTGKRCYNYDNFAMVYDQTKLHRCKSQLHDDKAPWKMIEIKTPFSKSVNNNVDEYQGLLPRSLRMAT